MNKVFSKTSWEEYLYWHTEDKKVLKRINDLIRDIERNGNEGMGKPEALKYELSGFWSRRITDEHRLVYAIDEKNVFVVSCRGHY